MGGGLGATSLYIIKIHMKHILAFLVVSYSVLVPAQNEKLYDLDWKLKPNEELIYKVSEEKLSIGENESSSSIWKTILNNLPDSIRSSTDSLDEIEDEASAYFKYLESAQRDFETFIVLRKEKPTKIDVKFFTRKAKDKSASEIDTLLNMMSMFNKGVTMRGELNDDGSISSFYMRQSQKNLLAMYFELPKYPVKIGDSWALQINLIEFDQNFICEKAEKRNLVELSDVKIINGDEIAILKYDIYERVEGNFLNSPTVMEISFSGNCEFSISKGRWENYSGSSKSYSSGLMGGFMGSNIEKKETLIEVNDISLEDLENN